MAEDLASRLAFLGPLCDWWRASEVYDPESPGDYRATLSLECRSMDANDVLRLATALQRAARIMRGA